MMNLPNISSVEALGLTPPNGAPREEAARAHGGKVSLTPQWYSAQIKALKSRFGILFGDARPSK